MKKLTATIVMALLTAISFAQVSGTITGKIKDGDQPNILASASINLLKASDSTLVKIGLANTEGVYTLENINAGNYLIMAHIIGYEKIYSKAIQISAENLKVNVPLLQLVPLAKKLDGVVVTARKNFIEQKIDKTVLNMDASITNTGNTILEVLEKAPGVSVNKDGVISLKGKQGVTVMIDGKPTPMSNADLTNYLSGIPSSNLDKIELMTNPSSKYDASGNSGIINIITKKNKRAGFNGSLALAYGRSDLGKTNNSLNLNYRKNKINIFTNLSANYRKQSQTLNINRIYSYPDKSVKAIFDQETTQDRDRQNYNGKIGMDYFVSKNTTLGMVVSGSTSPSKTFGESTTFLKNNSKITDSIVAALRKEDNNWKDMAVNFNLRHTIDSTGREITADLDYGNYKSFQDQYLLNSVFSPAYELKYDETLLGLLPSNINVYSAKVDYTHPLKKDLKLESGLKFSHVDTKNASNYFNVINQTKEVDDRRTSSFDYAENISAAYINMSQSIKKWGFQLGLRAENTSYNGKQYGNRLQADSSFKNSYINIFPTGYVSYKANDKNNFGFSAGRRIQRPDYSDLNPFLSFIDKYTYDEGNPYLKPMYSNVFELTHSYNQFLNTTLNYTQTKDLFNQVFRQNNQPNDSISTITGTGNFGKANSVSLSSNAQIKITKWFSSMLYAEGNYQELNGNFNGDAVNIKKYIFTVNVNNQFTFKKDWSAELSGFYRTPSNEGQLHLNALSQVDLAVKKDFLKKKASLKLSVRDVFGPMKATGYINFNNTLANFTQQRDSRVVTLGFNYRFGKPIKGLKNRKSGGAGDEQKRIGGEN